MGKKAEIDSEFEALIPPIAPEEFAALEQSILAEGCRHMVVTWNGLIIDGHNRAKICKKHGKSFGIFEMRLSSREDAMMWIIQNQFARRNLNDSQRVQLALRQKELIAARARPGTRTDLSENSPIAAHDTREMVAKIAGVSSNTVSKFERIKRRAVPEVKHAMDVGALSINAAAKLAHLPKEQQARLAAEGTQALKVAASQMSAKAPRGSDRANPEDTTVGDLRAENVTLKARVAELEHQVSEMRAENQRLSAMLDTASTEASVDEDDLASS